DSCHIRIKWYFAYIHYWYTTHISDIKVASEQAVVIRDNLWSYTVILCNVDDVLYFAFAGKGKGYDHFVETVLIKYRLEILNSAEYLKIFRRVFMIIQKSDYSSLCAA